MDHSQILPIINQLHNLSGESVSIILYLASVILIMFTLRIFGLTGLCAYSAVATILANLQVLKLGQFNFSPEPVALGSVTFATIFLTSDIITEHFGKNAAQKNVWISILMQVITTIIMTIFLGFSPIKGDDYHQALTLLFLPAPRLVISSLIAFAISQLFEISIFHWMARINHKKLLWLRTVVSVLISNFIDSFIFSITAWIILSPKPLPINTVIYTYILSTYLLRVVLAIASIPVMYLSYHFKPKKL